MKKTDLCFAGMVVVLAIVILGYFSFLGKEKGNVVIAEYDGSIIGEYLLNEDTEVLLNETNVLRIQSGEVTISEATCKDQICVLHHPIRENGESIICLPNKIVVTIVSQESSNVDAIAD